MTSKYRYAMVCSSNMNRSVSAHHLLKQHNFRVESYGSGNNVRLPGKSFEDPNVFPFGTPYKEIYQRLAEQDAELHRENGVLDILIRNIEVKEAPEHFQDSPEEFDVIVTAEERVFDQVVEHLEQRPIVSNKPVHIINMEIRDNPEDALLAAHDVDALCVAIDATDDLDDNIDDIIEAFQKSHQKQLLHSVAFY